MGLRERFLTALRGPEIEDGLGQSLITDLIWTGRFRRCRRMHVDWSAPDEAVREAWRAHPDLSRFGDFLVAATEVGGRRWRVVERIWHGWPDPPAYAFFAIETDDTIWAAADFDRWPEAWARDFGQTGDGS